MKQFVIKLNIDEESLTDQYSLASELLKALGSVNRKFQILSAEFEEARPVPFNPHPTIRPGIQPGIIGPVYGTRAVNEQRDGYGTSIGRNGPSADDV